MAAGQRARQSERELRAGEGAANIVQGRANIRERRADRAERARQFDETINQRELDRNTQLWERQRAERLARDEARRQQNQGDGSIFGGRDVRMFQSGSEGYRQPPDSPYGPQAGKDLKTELDAAKAGFVIQQPGQQPAAQTGAKDLERVEQALQQNPKDPRLKRLQEEMKRGREQMGMGIEQSGRRRIVPSPEAQQQQAEENALARTRAATDVYQAVTQRKRLGFEMQKWQAEMNAGGKDAKAELEKAAIRAQGPIEDWSDLLDRVEKSMGDPLRKGMRPNDWEKIAEQFKGMGDVGGSAAGIQQAIDSKQADPRLTKWMAEKQAKMVLDYVADGNGDLPPDGRLIDFLTDGMQQFVQQVKLAQHVYELQTGGPIGLLSAQDRNRVRRMANKIAAKAILNQQPLSESGMGEAMQGGAPPQGGAPDMPGARTPEQAQNMQQSRQPTQPGKPMPGEPGYVHPMGQSDSSPKWENVR